LLFTRSLFCLAVPWSRIHTVNFHSTPLRSSSVLRNGTRSGSFEDLYASQCISSVVALKVWKGLKSFTGGRRHAFSKFRRTSSVHVSTPMLPEYIVTYWGFYSRWVFIPTPKIKRSAVKYNQQQYKHVGTIHLRAIGPLARQNSTSAYSTSLNCHLLAPTIDCLHRPL
jgi:hypothetical protein